MGALDRVTRAVGSAGPSLHSSGLIRLGEPACDDSAVAGGKGAGLSRMVGAGLPVPPGFVVGAGAFPRSIGTGTARRDIAALLDAVDVGNAADLARTSRCIRELIQAIALPDDLAGALTEAYTHLGGPVAVRSSAIAEDSRAASYAGQQATYLDVAGADDVSARVRDCWASFFSAHAIFYRKQKGSLADVGIAVVVQRMIVPEKAGVMFTVDPIQRRRDRLVIEAVWGFGEALVSGLVTPDNYQVARRDGRVLRAFVPSKRVAFVRAPSRPSRPDGEVPSARGEGAGRPSVSDLSRSMRTRDGEPGGLVQVEVPEDRREVRVIDDGEICRLVALGLRLEALFGGPQDVEWGIAGGTIYILQSRPITAAHASPGGRR